MRAYEMDTDNIKLMGAMKTKKNIVAKNKKYIEERNIEMKDLVAFLSIVGTFEFYL